MTQDVKLLEISIMLNHQLIVPVDVPKPVFRSDFTVDEMPKLVNSYKLAILRSDFEKAVILCRN